MHKNKIYHIQCFLTLDDTIPRFYIHIKSLCQASYTPTFSKTLRPCYLNFPFKIYLLQHPCSSKTSLSLSLSISHIFPNHQIFFVVSTFSCMRKIFPRKITYKDVRHTNLNCLISCDKKPFCVNTSKDFGVNIYSK